EDGIRDKLVTGVQTCALPICAVIDAQGGRTGALQGDLVEEHLLTSWGRRRSAKGRGRSIRIRDTGSARVGLGGIVQFAGKGVARSEERRVGKESRWLWWQ